MIKDRAISLEALEIGTVGAAEMEEAVGVMVRGMGDNPNVVAALGQERERRHGKLLHLFGAMAAAEVPGRDRDVLAARGPDGSILGVCGMMPPGRCQPGPGRQLRLLPALLTLGPRSARHTLSWLGAWSKHDPDDRHWHLGPVAVDVHLQGLGIGSMLMRAFCERMDEAGEDAYLETDKEINVRFYEKFGFGVTGEEEVLGVRNWYMYRRARKRDQGSR
ncbi:MAG TPA: GNAT family N-acetyltransferase [Rubrobacter sp.]|nr:GNAT family N-acetyltransferase [Rubrobacter sp.]